MPVDLLAVRQLIIVRNAENLRLADEFRRLTNGGYREDRLSGDDLFARLARASGRAADALRHAEVCPPFFPISDQPNV